MENQEIPKIQHALQLVGADTTKLNTEKEVYEVGAHQIMMKVEAVGLCFSDLKLLKQFSDHARKSEVINGIDPEVLKEIPSYRPGNEPTVPGHEATCEIIKIGDKVAHHKVGDRVLVQADYRWLKTAGSNAAFGYNFEGALQQYILLDERVIMSPDENMSTLLPVSANLSSSSIALVEPWACVEDSYVTEERNRIAAGKKLLVVAEKGREIVGLDKSLSDEGKPAEVFVCCHETEQKDKVGELFSETTVIEKPSDLDDEFFDDIVYFGSDADTLEVLDKKLAAAGIMNIVLSGEKIARKVSVSVGRLHYGMTRWVGTVTDDASKSYENIPSTGEIRDNDRVLVTGAGGPMGQMHVIRLICSGKNNLEIVATDFDDDRLDGLAQKVEPLLKDNPAKLTNLNPKKENVTGNFSYSVIMAPVPELISQAIDSSTDSTLINIFAGIGVGVTHPLDINKYIENKCFMFGTSGSRLSDMKIVLDKLIAGRLDTNTSVDEVSGMAGIVDGLKAVENRTCAGKIIVYPQLIDLPLIPLDKLAEKYPTVGDKLVNGKWTLEAEEELLKVAG